MSFRWEKRYLLDKYRSRFFSLFIPFVLANLFFFTVVVFLKKLPLTTGYINADPIKVLENANLIEIISYLFLKPAAYHLWFLQNLMVIVCLSPLIYLILQRFKGAVYYFPLLFAGSFFVPILFDLFCFSGGAFFAIKNISPDRVKISPRKFYGLLLLTATAVGCRLYWGLHLPHIGMLLYISAWFLYDRIIDEKLSRSLPSKLFSYSFFIYLYHEPLIGVFKKTLIKLPWGQFSLWIGYIFSPLLTFCFLIIFGILFERFFPRIFGILTGGRTGKRKFSNVQSKSSEFNA